MKRGEVKKLINQFEREHAKWRKREKAKRGNQHG